MPSPVKHFHSLKQGLTDSVFLLWQGAHAVEEAADAAHASTQAAGRARCATMHPPLKICTAERAVCACLKRLVSEASQGRA